MPEATADRRILHIALVDDWTAAELVGHYDTSTIGRTLAEEGFLHCSFPSQVDGVFTRYYADVREPLCLLTIDPDLLDVPLVVEDVFDAGEEFPHIYGPLPVRAVVEVRPL